MSLGSFLSGVGKTALGSLSGSLGNLPSAAIGGIGSFISNSQAISNQKKLADYQAKISKDLAQFSADLNFAQWQKQNTIQNEQLRQNAIDSAALTAQGRKAAGFSAFGDSPGQLVGAPSGSSLGAFASSGMPSFNNSDPLDNALKIKQLDLLDAQANKTNKEADILSIDIDTEADLRSSLVEINKALKEEKEVNIKLGDQQFKFNADMFPKNLDMADKQIELFVAQTKQINTLRDLQGQEADLLEKENLNFWYKWNTEREVMLSQIKYNLAAAGLAAAEAGRIATLLQDELDNLQAQNANLRAGTKNINSQTAVNASIQALNNINYKFRTGELYLFEKYGEYQTREKMATDALSAVGSALFGVAAVKQVFSGSPMRWNDTTTWTDQRGYQHSTTRTWSGKDFINPHKQGKSTFNSFD